MSSSITSHHRTAPGFSLVEMLVVLALLGVLATMGVPAVAGAIEQFTFNSAARSVAADIRSARWAAVAKNRTMLLRFNCPAANQYRLVEFTGNPTIDGAADRCSTIAYPFPDAAPGVAPDADGPVITLPRGITFGLVQDLAFGPTGRVPASVTIGVTNGTRTRTITVPVNGRVAEQ